MKKIWPFSFYFLYFAAFAALLPFLVIFYQRLGFSGAQIGLLTGVPPLITIFCAPFGASLADSTRRHKLIMGLGILAAVIVVLLLSFDQKLYRRFHSHCPVQHIHLAGQFAER